MQQTVPNPDAHESQKWEGTLARKPWHYQVTAVIPCFEHVQETTLCVELLRLQTIHPYILLIDTGSRNESLEALNALRAADLEVHAIRCNSIPHPCVGITAALDLGFSLAATPFAFTTHQDCFLRDRHFLDYLVQLMPTYAVAGYQISPRRFPEWPKWFGHTAALWSIAELDRIGATWSLRRAASMLAFGTLPAITDTESHIDTESAINTAILRAGLRTLQIGTEQNFERTLDQWIDHPRSLICTSLYYPPHHAKARTWCDQAMTEARDRIERWKTHGSAEPCPEPDLTPAPGESRLHPTDTTDRSQCSQGETPCPDSKTPSATVPQWPPPKSPSGKTRPSPSRKTHSKTGSRKSPTSSHRSTKRKPSRF
jgi:hypothetical protein